MRPDEPPPRKTPPQYQHPYYQLTSNYSRIFSFISNQTKPTTFSSKLLPNLYTLEDERLEPTAITHEKKGTLSEPNLHDYVPGV